MGYRSVAKRTGELQAKGLVLFTTDEAAKRLRVSPRSLEKWRVLGTGPAFVKIGRLCFYVEDSMTAWLESRNRKSTSDPGKAATGE